MRSAVTLALAVFVLGCGTPAPSSIRGEQVPLITLEGQTCCFLSYSVVDVKASSTFGTVIKGTDMPLRWPAGYTAWRAGSEVEVRDPDGTVVLTTGARYWISPTQPDWVVGEVRLCPECELGGGPL
jgi:hypothetical protein